jgi:hypothetical protein
LHSRTLTAARTLHPTLVVGKAVIIVSPPNNDLTQQGAHFCLLTRDAHNVKVIILPTRYASVVPRRPVAAPALRGAARHLTTRLCHREWSRGRAWLTRLEAVE